MQQIILNSQTVHEIFENRKIEHYDWPRTFSAIAQKLDLPWECYQDFDQINETPIFPSILDKFSKLLHNGFSRQIWHHQSSNNTFMQQNISKIV